MNTNSFYVTLPSNTGSDNKTGHFTVTLPQTISLSGEWEVAMTEIIYPYTWINFPRKHESEGVYSTTFYVGVHHAVVKVEIPPAHYETVEYLITAINEALGDIQVKVNENDINSGEEEQGNGTIATTKLSKVIMFRYNTNSKKVKMVIMNRKVHFVNLSKHMAYVLGFSNNWNTIFSGTSCEAKYMPDMSAGINTLYVYLNIIQPQLVGDSFSPLLRIIHVDGRHGMTVEKVFFNRQYIPVMQKDFGQLEMHIKTDGNQDVQFDSGKVIATLHFQRRRLLFD